MKITDRGLILYADSFQIPRRISIPIIKLFDDWSRCSGDEWTVSRIKLMKLCFIQLKAGHHPSHPWISFRSPDIIRGPFGGLQKWASFSHKRWSKAILLLQIYTSKISTKVTPLQEKKFLDGVMSEPVEIPESYKTMMIGAINRLGLYIPFIQSPRPLVLEQFSSKRFAPHPSGRSYPEDQSVLESLAYTRQTSFGLGLRSKYHKIFDSVEEGIEVDDSRDADVVDYSNSVGKIGIIQEAGFKLRAVANPGRVYQQALRPLGDQLFSLLSHLPWDCTHDQSKAFVFIQQRLQSNHVCHSIDLTGATDYFPFELQLIVLNKIVRQKEYVNLFRDISRGQWIYKRTKIRWTRGQPLGLYPSFASFALTHGLLLFALNNYSFNNEFFVLGDDVVILDSVLYQRYIQALDDLKCPVSASKSVNSSILAEFAGKIVINNMLIHQFKWRQVSDDSFLDIVRNVGSRSVRLLRKRQRIIAKILWEVPDFLGGLGFNPFGKPLDQRVFEALVLKESDSSRKYLLSYTKMLNLRNYYDKKAFPTPVHFRIQESDFDKKSLALVQTYLPTLIKWYDISGGNLFRIKDDLLIPIEGNISRSSLLERMEYSLLQ